MSVEFIGFITNNNSSETIVRTGPVIDRPSYGQKIKSIRKSGNYLYPSVASPRVVR
jgi:hypothetical protein